MVRPERRPGARRLGPERRDARQPAARLTFPRRIPYVLSHHEPWVRIVPLGGLGEIGMNMTLLETEEDVLVVDAGLMFP